MKKILGLVVAVAFAFTATAVLAEETKKVEATKTTPSTVAKEEVKFDYNKCLTECKADKACVSKCDTEKAKLASASAPKADTTKPVEKKVEEQKTK